MINNMLVERVTNFKFLGIVFDENTTWKYHIETVEKKLYCTARMIYQTRSYLDVKALKMIFDSIVQSYVNYGNSVLVSTRQTKFKRIFIKQKQISRMICFKNKQCHFSPLMRRLGVLNVFQIVCK